MLLEYLHIDGVTSRLCAQHRRAPHPQTRPGISGIAPKKPTLYRIVQSHLNPFLAFVDTQTGGSGLPTFVTNGFDAFLACGILAHGLLRLRCDGCKEEKRVAFSCKHRGICPAWRV